MGTGLIHIYTGDGKGKTTAAVGLAVRALGHGMKVLYMYFNKKPGLYGYNEIQNLRQLGARVIDFDDFVSENHDLAGLVRIVTDENPDLLILDEILISVQYGMIDEHCMLEFLAQKPSHLEVVLTGRGANDELIAVADYVSNIQKIKHPFDRKIYSREGIEY